MIAAFREHTKDESADRKAKRRREQGMTTDSQPAGRVTAHPPFASASGSASVLSLGGGVQSTAMLLLSIHGELERPDLAIFADTQDESRATYDHMTWLREKAATAGIPLETVTRGRLSDAVLHKSQRKIAIPTFGSRGGMMPRQCTREFKVDVISRRLRELKRPVELWIGISLDEVHRMKESGKRWMKNRWPLIEKRMTRWDCLRWLAANKYAQPPKSACIFCPYHSNEYWRGLREQPEEWEKAKAIDGELNKRGEYLHRSLTPLGEVDLRTEEEHGQETMFGNECFGHCGV